MRALSIRSPWWWCILYAGKDIENRSWPTNFRGTIAVHASQWWQGREVDDHLAIARNIWRQQGARTQSMGMQEMRALGGHLVGTVEIVGCVSSSVSPWFFGPYGFVLANPIAFVDPVPCRGALSFFEVRDEISQLRRRSVVGQGSLFAAPDQPGPQEEGE